MSGWFANVSDLKRIELPAINGWIEVRQELTVGEQRKMFSRAFKGQVQLEDGTVRNEYDMAEISFGQVCAYLVNWSEKGAITPDAIKALTPEAYGLIETAVGQHVESLTPKKTTATHNHARRGTTRRPTTSDKPISPSAGA